MASEVKSWQVGLVNLSGYIEGGLPIRLLNYSRNGLFNLSTWRDEVGFTMFTLASGSRSFYTAFTTGFADQDGQRRRALGVGGGVQKRGERFSSVSIYTATGSAATFATLMTITARALDFGRPQWTLV